MWEDMLSWCKSGPLKPAVVQLCHQLSRACGMRESLPVCHSINCGRHEEKLVVLGNTWEGTAVGTARRVLRTRLPYRSNTKLNSINVTILRFK